MMNGYIKIEDEEPDVNPSLGMKHLENERSVCIRTLIFISCIASASAFQRAYELWLAVWIKAIAQQTAFDFL